MKLTLKSLNGFPVKILAQGKELNPENAIKKAARQAAISEDLIDPVPEIWAPGRMLFSITFYPI